MTSDPEGYRAARNSLRRREHEFTLPGASNVQLRAGLSLLGTECKSFILSTHSFNNCLTNFLSPPFSQALPQQPCSLPSYGIQTACNCFGSHARLPSRIPPSPSRLLSRLKTEQRQEHPAVFILFGPVSFTSHFHTRRLIFLHMMSLWL